MTDTERERLANFSAHAGRIAALLETWSAGQDVRYWRAPYFIDGDLYMGGFSIRQDELTLAGQGTARVTVVSCSRTEEGDQRMIQGPTLAAEEIALFLGLAETPYEDLEWREVKDPIKARAQAAGLELVRGGGVVTPGRPGYH